MTDNDIGHELQSPLQGKLVVRGQGNVISTGANSEIAAMITIEGDNNRLIIGERCVVRGAIGFVRVNNTTIRIGDRTTLAGVLLQAHEPHNIEIGADCMFSTEVFVSSSDMHPIFDEETGARINPAAAIDIADHVWVGFRSIIAKGVSIGAGSIIGAGSVVTSAIPAGVVAAGNPARVLRENVSWRRSLRS